MSFPLCGNDRVRESIEKALLSRRMPHTILLEGNPGTGKRTLAKYIAKSVLCESDIPPCNVCRSCHLADVGTHPDIDILAPEDKKKSISVKQIDEFRDIAYLSPHTASGKVLIIEQADTMSTISQNKLLKVLEEPPVNVYFILICSSASALLDTVVSRSTIFSLYEPDFNSAFENISKHCSNREKIVELLKVNNNNIGKTLEALGSSKTSVGITTAEHFLELIISKKRLDALRITVKLEKNRPETNVFIKELKQILTEKIKLSGKLRETRLEFSKMYNVVHEMESLLDTNINLSLFFTALVSKLMSIK